MFRARKEKEKRVLMILVRWKSENSFRDSKKPLSW
jgi:hypothetical protein